MKTKREEALEVLDTLERELNKLDYKFVFYLTSISLKDKAFYITGIETL